MRWQPLTLVAIGLLMAADQPAVGDEKEAAVKEDMKQLQGNWTVVSIQVNGKDLPQDKIGDPNASVNGDEYRIHDFRLRLTIDPTKKPKTIDMIGLKTGQVLLTGLYELEGDTWKICLPVGNAARPKAIKSEPGSKSGIIVYKRVKGCSVKKGDRTPKGDIHNNRTERFAAADRPR